MLLVANLDCDFTWAREDAQQRGIETGRDVPGRIADRLAALGSLMALLAWPGDSIWVPQPIDSSRVVPGGGCPVVRQVIGALENQDLFDGLLAWGETRDVEALRPKEEPVASLFGASDWLGKLREIYPTSAAVARNVNRRRFGAELAQRDGVALPGARMLTSLDELRAHLAAGGADASPTGEWVVKAPFGVAGRGRARGAASADAEREDVRRLFATEGELLFEPWMDVGPLEFGTLGMVSGLNVHVVGCHVQETNGGGSARSVRPLPDDVGTSLLGEADATKLRDVTARVGAALADAGYRGPFGVDAYRHTDSAGVSHLHTFGELNARLTVGFLARAAAEASGWEHASGEPGPALEVGGRDDLDAAVEAKGSSVRPLLLPGDTSDVAAWLVA